MKKTLQLDFSNKASNVSIDGEIVTKLWGDGLGWTIQEAEEVLSDHTQYLANMASVGIATSEIISRVILQNTDGNYFIKEQELHAGRDLSIALLESSDVKDLTRVINNGFKASARLLTSIPPRENATYSNDNPWLGVPVDLKPQNVVFNVDSVYPLVIDTFGPKIWLNGNIKPLPTKTPGMGQIQHDEIKVGDVRFALGRLNGYFVALATRWLVNQEPEVSNEAIDLHRNLISDILIEITKGLVEDNDLFEKNYADLLISDASQTELRSIEYGTYEGPRYVQELYELEDAL